jgi:hypothetical protein
MSSHEANTAGWIAPDSGGVGRAKHNAANSLRIREFRRKLLFAGASAAGHLLTGHLGG